MYRVPLYTHALAHTRPQWYCESGYGFAAKSLLDAMGLSDMATPARTFPELITLFVWQGQLDAADALIATSTHLDTSLRTYIPYPAR